MMTRGVNHSRELWVAAMQSQYFNWTRKNLETGQDEIIRVQGALRPIELWEYVFPEDALPEVLTMLNMTNKDGKGAFDAYGPRGKILGSVLRKVLSCKPIPNIDPVQTNKFIPQMGFNGSPIGIKKDDIVEWGEKGVKQEML